MLKKYPIDGWLQTLAGWVGLLDDDAVDKSFDDEAFEQPAILGFFGTDGPHSNRSRKVPAFLGGKSSLGHSTTLSAASTKTLVDHLRLRRHPSPGGK